MLNTGVALIMVFNRRSSFNVTDSVASNYNGLLCRLDDKSVLGNLF